MSHRVERRRARWVVLACAPPVLLTMPSAATGEHFQRRARTLGAIQDGGSLLPGLYGAGREVSFVVPPGTFNGAANPTEVAVTLTMSHTWVGDLDVVLRPADRPQRDAPQPHRRSLAAARRRRRLGPRWVPARSPTRRRRRRRGGRQTHPSEQRKGRRKATIPRPPPFWIRLPTRCWSPALSGATANGTWKVIIRDGLMGDTGEITAASLELVAPKSRRHRKRREYSDRALGAPPEELFGAPLDVTFQHRGSNARRSPGPRGSLSPGSTRSSAIWTFA